MSSASSGGGGGGGGAAPNANLPTMCAINLEAYQAINLLTLDWGPPKATLQAILTAIASTPTVAIHNNAVVHLNNIIGKDRQGRKLAAIIATLKAKYPNLRKFAFPMIQAVLTNAKKTSNF